MAISESILLLPSLRFLNLTFCGKHLTKANLIPLSNGRLQSNPWCSTAFMLVQRLCGLGCRTSECFRMCCDSRTIDLYSDWTVVQLSPMICMILNVPVPMS